MEYLRLSRHAVRIPSAKRSGGPQPKDFRVRGLENSTWNDAVVRWLKEQSHKATAGENVGNLRWLQRYLGDKDLTHIRRATLDRIIDGKLALGHRNATVNRTLEPVRAILRKCVNRASRRGSPGAVCGALVSGTCGGERNRGARFGTVPKTARACHRQALDCLVAGAGFEPATFGL